MLRQLPYGFIAQVIPLTFGRARIVVQNPIDPLLYLRGW
jgi:hypothetical protein